MKKIKILIADDHQLVLDGLASLINGDTEFELAGSAYNGKQAIELFNQAKPDVVLMDIDMPLLNGIDATLEIMKTNPFARIIALTMHNEKGMINKMLDAGASGYILKNIDRKELSVAIKKVADGNKYFSSEITLTLLDKNSTPLQSSKSPDDTSNLTPREKEILTLVAQGLSNREIGEKLFISARTVDTHRTNLMEKLEVNNIAGLIRYAIKNGFLD